MTDLSAMDIEELNRRLDEYCGFIVELYRSFSTESDSFDPEK